MNLGAFLFFFSVILILTLILIFMFSSGRRAALRLGGGVRLSEKDFDFGRLWA